MVATRVAKITISLPKELLEVADRLAKERATTRSSIIAALLKKEERTRIEALMIEGYKEMAEENLRFAEDSIPLALEIMPEWTEHDRKTS